MSDYKSNTKIKFSSEKSFGILFSLVFLLLFIISIIYYDNINFIFLTSSIVLLSFSFIYPKIFKYPNNAWINLGLLLGKVVSPIVMIIIYLCVFFPFGVGTRLLRIDLLDRNFSKNQNSYWKIRKHKINSMKRMY